MVSDAHNWILTQVAPQHQHRLLLLFRSCNQGACSVQYAQEGTMEVVFIRFSFPLIKNRMEDIFHQQSDVYSLNENDTCTLLGAADAV